MGKSAPKIKYERVDLDQLAQQARDAARQNIEESIALEQEFDPTVAQFREQSLQDLLGAMGAEPSDEVSALRRQLFQEITAPAGQLEMPELEQSQLLQAAEERAMEDLLLGGELSQDLRNLVLRESAERGGEAGFLGGIAGRDIGARDLGLTSLDLMNQRLNRAAQLGSAQQARNVQQQGLAGNIAQLNQQLRQQQLGNLMQGTGMFEGLEQQDFANRFGLAQFGQGIQRPIAGLDPGQLASAAVADVNTANQMAAQQAGLKAQTKQSGLQNLLSLGGLGLQAFGLGG